MKIPFGEFAPDSDGVNKNISTVAENVIPVGDGYKPLPGITQEITLASYGTSMTVVGASSTQANLYAVSTKGLNDISCNNNSIGAAGSTNASFIEGYPFVEWDDHLIIAGAGNTPQKIAFSDLPATACTVLSDSPPNAYCAAKLREFLVLGRTYESAVEYQNRVRWSGFNDYNGWTTGVNQAGFQDLPNASPITRVIGGEVGIIFQTDAITRMTYVGSPLIFQFDTVEQGKGTLAGKSVVQDGNDIYYFGRDGFYVLKNGTTSVPIGKGKVDRWFLDNYGYVINDYGLNSYQKIQGAKDSVSGCIFWSFDTNTTVTDGNDRLLIYNPSNDRWSYAVLTTGSICSIEPPSYTADSQNHGLGFIYDSGASWVYSYFDDTQTALSTTLETGEFGQDSKTRILEVRPLIDGTSTVTTKTRDTLGAVVTSTGPTSLDSTGKANVRTNARYTRIQCTTSGSYTEASGVEVKLFQGGGR